jgi:ABC-type transport system involved in multi-copper enzyme maturation permease subunit
MFRILFTKEILENFTSRRFFIILALCLILIPLGAYVSTRDYQSRLHSYQESLRLYEESHKWVSDVLFKGAAGFRPPSPLSFLSLGLEIVLPNVAETRSKATTAPVDMRFNNNQSLDNLYEFFQGPLDLVFIVSVVMTFLAIVFTYGSISGEKEQGTLKQVLCNSVPRHQVILSKVGANFLVLIIPFLIALLLSLLLLQVKGFLPFGPAGILAYLALAFLFSLLLIAAFFNLGLLVSSLTKQAVSAIIILLLCWVFLFGIFPRLSVILSQVVYPVKSQQLVALEKNLIRVENEKECEAEVGKLLESSSSSGLSEKETTDRQEVIREEFRASLVSKFQKVESEIEKKRNTQMLIASNLARLSPVSCFIRPLAEMSHTGLLQYQTFKEEVSHFEQTLNKEIYSKYKIRRQKGGSANVNFEGDQAVAPPKFQYSLMSLQSVVKDVLPDFILLAIYNILFFAAAFVAFLRYDVR